MDSALHVTVRPVVMTGPFPLNFFLGKRGSPFAVRTSMFAEAETVVCSIINRETGVHTKLNCINADCLMLEKEDK